MDIVLFKLVKKILKNFIINNRPFNSLKSTFKNLFSKLFSITISFLELF